MLEYSILIILIVFATTTMFYIILYWRTTSRGLKLHALKHDIDMDEEIAKLREALPGKESKLEALLAELKKIRRRAELLLDEGRGSEGEGGGDKGGPEGD